MNYKFTVYTLQSICEINLSNVLYPNYSLCMKNGSKGIYYCNITTITFKIYGNSFGVMISSIKERMSKF